MENILVIDDDRELCELLNEYLTPEGFEVEAAYNGETGIEKVLHKQYCIVVLDIMLPGGQNGFDVLQRIRTRTGIPVIMLTARGDDVDRIVGLEMGADDYLAKPFNPRELLARIRAILRRSRTMQEEMTQNHRTKKYRYGDLELDSGARIVLKANKVLKLTNVEFQLLENLMRHSGNVVSRDDLANDVLDRPLSPYDRSIDVHVCKLRKKLGAEPNGSERIKAIRGTGYIFVSSSSSEEETPGREDGLPEEADHHA
ncbi:response regulator transcription factor [bacterium]|nr:response regulator transcription factor [bacterium]